MVFIGNYSEMISIGYDVGVKRSFDPFDTGLLRTACSHNPQKHSQSAHFSAKNGFWYHVIQLMITIKPFFVN